MNCCCVILGCGGSDGVPKVGCSCVVCRSSDNRNRRTRPSILLEMPNSYRVLVDTSPDLRVQMLAYIDGMREDHDYAVNHNTTPLINTIIYTHAHYDHTAGINDIRHLIHPSTPAFMDAVTAQKLQDDNQYIFAGSSPLYPPLLTAITFHGPFSVNSNSYKVIPFLQQHGYGQSCGFRFGSLAYSTDVSKLDAQAFSLLNDLDVWIIDGHSYCYSPTHFCLEETIAAIRRVKPRLAILTHLNHVVEYGELCKILPRHITPAYDGMRVEFRWT